MIRKCISGPGFVSVAALFAAVLVTESRAQPSPKMFVVLHPETSKAFPKNENWQPTEVDIEGAEAGLSQISSLRAENWGKRNIRIDHPEQNFRQYIGVVRNGKRQIYVNAICAHLLSSFPNWRTGLIQADDGGSCFWQAFYDPAEKKYMVLRINGDG